MENLIAKEEEKGNRYENPVRKVEEIKIGM